MESSDSETSKMIRWQRKLLPLMISILVGLTTFFFVASFIQLYYLHKQIAQSPELTLDPALNLLKSAPPNITKKEKLDTMRWITLSLLEGHALQRRYHQANVLLMARTWTRYLGFVTGMVLAIVGATFILGKLREPPTKLDSEFDIKSSPWKFSITSASPGLILALIGLILMLTTMVTHYEIKVTDGPLYIEQWFDSSPPTTTPPELFEQQTETSAEEIDPEKLLDEMMERSGTPAEDIEPTVPVLE